MYVYIYRRTPSCILHNPAPASVVQDINQTRYFFTWHDITLQSIYRKCFTKQKLTAFEITHPKFWSRGSVVGVMTRLRPERPRNRRFDSQHGIFSRLQRQVRLWRPHSLLSSGFQGRSPPIKGGRVVKPTTHFHLASSVISVCRCTYLHFAYVFMPWCMTIHWDNFPFVDLLVLTTAIFVKYDVKYC
jgi:hypothetical protein